jgi:hypothetical protein
MVAGIAKAADRNDSLFFLTVEKICPMVDISDGRNALSNWI